MKRNQSRRSPESPARADLVDREVIARCQARDKEAFGELYNASIPYVLHIVRDHIKSEETIKDIVQEIYSRAFLAIDSYSFNKGAFRPWLRRIAVNQCLTHIRDSGRKAKVVELSDEFNHIPEERTDAAFNRLHPEVAQQMLGLMPTGYRTVFDLVVMNGYSHEEAGEELGISAQTSRSQLARGKKWLRNYLNSDKNLVNHG